MMVDHQNILLSWCRLSEKGQIPISRAVIQLVRPAGNKGGMIELLMFLSASRDVRSAGDPLVVDNFAAWLIQDAKSLAPNLETKIGIFVVSWCVDDIESADGFEQGLGDHQSRRRAVINFPKVVIFGFAGVVALTVIPRRAIAPRDATCFLQASIRINQLRSDHASLWFFCECVQQ